MARHYTSLRAFTPIADKKCARCKQPLPASCLGLAYRGGRGNFLTAAFHPACAARERPRLAAAFLADAAARGRARREQVDELRAALAELGEVEPATDGELAWWSSGELYDVELASAPSTCAGSGASIVAGELVFVRPRQDFGVTHRDVFSLGYGLSTSDFDERNFADRLAVSASQQGADRLRDALEAAAAAHPAHADRLRTAARALATTRVTVHGLDRKGGKKQDLRWDLFFAGKVAAKTRTAATAELAAASASWEHGRILTVRYDDPTGKTSLATFRDQVAGRLEALHAATPLYAAHFCRDGDLRASRAKVLADLGEPPYPFVYVGHGRESAAATAWELLVRLARAPAAKLRAQLAGELDALSLRAAWAGRWLRITHTRDGAYARWVEAKLDPVLEALAGIELALLRGPSITGEGDPWHAWSATQPVPRDAELPSFTRDEPDEAELRRLVAEARALHEADDAMDDPGADIDAFERILARIPKRRREHREVKQMLDELLQMLARS